MKKAASIFSIFCGLAMLVVWAILLATGQVIELQTKPFETIFLLVAEFLTAVSLILGGFGLVSGKSWGLRADLAALGMLLYCTIFSTGALGVNNAPAAVFFSMMALMAFFFSTRFILDTIKGGTR